MRKVLLAALMLLLVPIGGWTAQVPALNGHVNDYASVLDATQRATMDELLAEYEKETTHEIAVLTIPSLGGESIERYSLGVAKAWALGRKGLDNGVLLIVALNEHQVRIEFGTGMLGYIPDALARKIIDDMLVRFRAGDIGGGILEGVRQLMSACRAYKVPESSPGV